MTDKMDAAINRLQETIQAEMAGQCDEQTYDVDAAMQAKDAEIARLTTALEAGQRNNRDTFDAMCAMRNAINEHVPMPSLESDLLQGPENSVFCETVAGAVIAASARLTAELAALRAQAESLWIQFGSAGALGRTIRKWDTTPFDGGQEFRAQSAPVGGEKKQPGQCLGCGGDARPRKRGAYHHKPGCLLYVDKGCAV